MKNWDSAQVLKFISNKSSILLQESQAHFDGFTEWLQTFELYRGKQSEDVFEDESRVVGKFKVKIADTYTLAKLFYLVQVLMMS